MGESVFFGETVRGGEIHVCVNSAQGNRSAAEVFAALGSAVGSDGSVPKALLLERVRAVTNEAPPADQTIFGAAALRRYAAARLAALTRHTYTPQGVGKVMRGFDFIERTSGLDWTCTGSLDTAIQVHVAARAETWKANLNGEAK